MATFGIKRQLREARRRAMERIEARARDGGFYAAGLSSEGYDGGYVAALDDVELALNIGEGRAASPYWPKKEEE